MRRRALGGRRGGEAARKDALLYRSEKTSCQGFLLTDEVLSGITEI